MSPHAARASRPARRTRLVGFAGLVPLAVAVAALAVAGLRPVAELEPAAEPSSRLVSAGALACPAFPLGADSAADTPGAATDVAVVAPDSGGGSRAGAVVARTGGAGGTAVVETDQPGPWVTGRLSMAEAADVVVESSGALGAGAAAFTAQTFPPEAGGGLAVQRCDAPARQWWFTGAGSSTERESTLVLSNVDASEAVVDVVLRTERGVADTVGTEGVRVRAGEVVTLPLGGLVAGTDEVAAEVDATQGRVVAAVADDWSGGVDSLGSDWLAPGVAPSTRLLLPGVVDAGPRSRLVLANPTDSVTPVDVAVVDDTGTFVPTGKDAQVSLPASGVASVPLPEDIGDGAAVLVEADTPVTAAVRVASGSDVAYTAGAPELTGPAVVPLDLGDSTDDVEVRLQLAAAAAPDGDDDGDDDAAGAANVTVTGYDADGAETASGDVSVAPGTGQLVDPRDDLDFTAQQLRDTAYLVVAPAGRRGGSVLLGAAVLRAPDGRVAVLPLDPGLERVETPVLVPSVAP